MVYAVVIVCLFESLFYLVVVFVSLTQRCVCVEISKNTVRVSFSIILSECFMKIDRLILLSGESKNVFTKKTVREWPKRSYYEGEITHTSVITLCKCRGD